MRAVEFETSADNGVISIPEQYHEFAQHKVRVIVMVEEPQSQNRRTPGSAKGQVWMSNDFDAPLTEDEIPEFFQP